MSSWLAHESAAVYLSKNHARTELAHDSSPRTLTEGSMRAKRALSALPEAETLDDEEYNDR
jgi:hypothetical protein